MKLRILMPLAVAIALAAGMGRADDQPDAKVLLHKAMKAMNSEAKLVNLGIATAKLKLTGSKGGQDFSVDIDGHCQALSQYRAELQFQGGGQNFNGALVLNGDKGWLKKMDKVEPAPEGIADFIQNVFYAGRMPLLLPALAQKDFKLTPLGEVTVGTQAALGLSISHKDRKDVSLFFDKGTGLPIKSEIRLDMPRQNKEVTVEYLYCDYKDYEGVKLPSKIALKVDTMEHTLALLEIKSADKLDDGHFGEP